ncbi:hypothetical protein BDV96DRAFT_638471 [Lophiotrema nucula]|uniref:DUF4110 domain-containing protein n=1 Tax=Lophiotrema nucula TaxID=690887 RepID=A0A6A5YGY0_9PLEO|nr:hypothetical protein BDV96DRAFT_638471 [Lophiotrema nucula]
MAKDKKAKGDKKATKAAKAAKQEKKAGKKEKKLATKNKDVDSDEESVDLDDVLAQYAKEQEQYHAITEVTCDPPSARTSSTLLAHPANENELFHFGGEHFNGATARFFNDLMIYNVKKDEWKKVTSPNSPLPRSGHAWCRGGNTKDIYLFGGEFSSPKQGTFYHYNDFWRLEPTTREWTRVEGKSKAAGPPARSGHRMVGFKQYIVVFGGFQDTSATTKYLNDIWIYDCTTFAWHAPKLASARAIPDARSSFTFLPHEQGAVLYGGYSRVKAAAAVNKQQQQARGKKGGGGGAGASRMVLKPKVHEDTWFLRITPPASDAPLGTLPTVSWERRKRPANPPNPPRAGATMTFHKGRGIMFGGVHDVEDSEEAIDSEFFNQLFVWNIERNRYMPLTLRRPKANANKRAAQQGNLSRRERAKADEEELLANLKALEMKAGGGDATSDDIEAPPKPEEEEDDKMAEKPRIFEFPHPRFNAALAVQADTLYIYGGTFEKGDREFTFDELWSVNLNHLDGVAEIFKRDLEDWQGSEDEPDSDEEDDDGEEEEDDDEDDDDKSEVAFVSTAPTGIPSTPKTVPEEDVGTTEEISALTDTLPHPRPFESLRDFYARTSEQWQNLVLEELSTKGQGVQKSPKEIKKVAFGQAEEKWWDCREEIRVLEDEQEAAGIGEVVSLADKQAAGEGAGGVGRRSCRGCYHNVSLVGIVGSVERVKVKYSADFHGCCWLANKLVYLYVTLASGPQDPPPRYISPCEDNTEQGQSPSRTLFTSPRHKEEQLRKFLLEVISFTFDLDGDKLKTVLDSSTDSTKNPSTNNSSILSEEEQEALLHLSTTINNLRHKCLKNQWLTTLRKDREYVISTVIEPASSLNTHEVYALDILSTYADHRCQPALQKYTLFNHWKRPYKNWLKNLGIGDLELQWTIASHAIIVEEIAPNDAVRQLFGEAIEEFQRVKKLKGRGLSYPRPIRKGFLDLKIALG